MRIFLMVKMNGYTEQERKEELNYMKNYISNNYQDATINYNLNYNNNRMEYLGQVIKDASLCDAVALPPNWISDMECNFLQTAADRYLKGVIQVT